jgi:hypothetical protein
MMGFYRKKPVVIEAFQIEGDGQSMSSEMHGLIKNSDRQILVWPDGSISIETLEGSMSANPGDWIIRGVKGEFYPCKPDIFAATYDAVSRDESRDSKP